MSVMLTALFSAGKELTILFKQWTILTVFEAVYSSEYTRTGEQRSSDAAASDRSLVWRAADRCR